MKIRKVETKVIDTDYKNGKVECTCGWCKELGDGFNRYLIEKCPNCCTDVYVRIQEKVHFWNKEKNTSQLDEGVNKYFMLSNGINVRFSFVGRTRYGIPFEF